MADDREALDLLQALVAVPSPSRRETAAVELLVNWMAGRGFDARRDLAGNAVGSRGLGPREILLLGHIDTFPGVVPSRIESGRLYGRGAVDAKGPLAAFAVAAARVGVPAGWRVTVVGAVEEEYWTSRGVRHVVSSWGPRPPPATVVVGEPSHWDRITLGYRGSVELRLRLRTPWSHSAGSEPLPAERAVELWAAVEAFCASNNERRPGAEFERFDAALRSIRTRTVGVLGEAVLVIGLRLPPGARLAAVTRQLRSFLRGRVEAWGMDGAEMTARFRGGVEAHRASKSTALVSAFLAAIRAEGGDPRFVVKTGTADFNVIGPAWPTVPLAAYGPGDSAMDHSPDENIEIEEFFRAIRVLTGVLARTMNSPPPSSGLQPC